MKYTRQQIKDVSLSAASHAEALATLYEMIREEIEHERKITRRKIRAAYSMTLDDFMQRYAGTKRPREEDQLGGLALLESVFAAAGWTIVDDDPEMQGITQPQTGEQAKRLRTLHQARELLDSLINETAKKEPDNVKGWQPIETEPKDRNVIFLAFSDRPEANGLRGFWAAEEKYIPIYGGRFASQPTHWMPIPPLPESDK